MGGGGGGHIVKIVLNKISNVISEKNYKIKTRIIQIYM